MARKTPNEHDTCNEFLAKDSKRFSVQTYTTSTEVTQMYTHWGDKLNMIIVKDGVVLKLNSEEIQQLVKTLPPTVGGSY